jgi:hypothetical protein
MPVDPFNEGIEPAEERIDIYGRAPADWPRPSLYNAEVRQELDGAMKIAIDIAAADLRGDPRPPRDEDVTVTRMVVAYRILRSFHPEREEDHLPDDDVEMWGELIETMANVDYHLARTAAARRNPGEFL